MFVTVEIKYTNLVLYSSIYCIKNNNSIHFFQMSIKISCCYFASCWICIPHSQYYWGQPLCYLLQNVWVFYCISRLFILWQICVKQVTDGWVLDIHVVWIKSWQLFPSKFPWIAAFCKLMNHLYGDLLFLC